MHCRRYWPVALSLLVGGLLVVGLLLLLGGALPVAHAASSTLYVKPGGTGTACSSSSPCSLQTALAQAGDGATIYLAEGVYTGTGPSVITVTKSITLYGGWDGSASTPPTRDPALHPSILDGEEARRVVYLSGPATVVLDGIAIANGRVLSNTAPWQGAGLYARNVTLTLRHVDVYSNVLDVYDAAGSTSYGGGVAVEGGVLLVEDSLFRRNGNWARSSSLGGGLSVSGTLSVTVTNSRFQENDAWHASGVYLAGNSTQRTIAHISNCLFEDNGWNRSPGSAFGGYAGAVKIAYADAHLVGNRFWNNQAVNDYGALYVIRSTLEMDGNVITGTQCARVSGAYLWGVEAFTLTNNIIADNRSTYYWISSPAVKIENSVGRLLHNTVARNRNFSGNNVGEEYGVLVVGSSTAWLTNTILVSHTLGVTATAGSTATLEGTLWGSGAWANGTDWGGDGTILTGTVNIWGDPAFVDPDGGDYHIGPASAARDAGVDAGVTTDIDGDPRLPGSAPDIGADEARAIYLPLVVRNW